MPPATTTSAPPPDRRRRIVILAVCCMSLLIVGMDNTIVNVALPSIGHDLHASISGLQWTVDAYVMVLASLLMLSGSMGDRLGRRRTFQTGLVIFSVGSAACGLAPGLGWLVAFRMLQAVGGSMLNPVAMSIIRNVFTDPRERAQAIGIWGAVVGISLGLGPVVGGALVQSVGWRSIFWVNVPIGIAAIVLAARFVPESRADHARRVDPVGQFLVIVVLASVTFAIIEGPGRGWSSPEIVGLFVAAAVALAALLFYEPRRVEPLIELRFFRSVPFTGATLTALLAFAGFSGFLFLNTLYLQQVQGRSALAAGLLTLPIAGMTIVMAPISGWLVGRRGTRLPLVVAGSALTVSSLVLTGLATTTSVTLLIVTYLVFGLGFGLVNPPITNTAVSGMPPSQAGVAAGVASTSRQVGQSLGVAVVGAAATSNLHGPIATGLAQASHAGWWIVAACSAGVIVLGVVSSSKRALATAEPLAALLEPEQHGGAAAAAGTA